MTRSGLDLELLGKAPYDVGYTSLVQETSWTRNCRGRCWAAFGDARTDHRNVHEELGHHRRRPQDWRRQFKGAVYGPKAVRREARRTFFASMEDYACR